VVESRLKRICFYTSDYGYGHAARDVAVIRGLLDQNDFQILVRTYVPFQFMRKSLPSVRVFQRKNDVGVFMNGAKADAKKTGQMVDAWVDSWDSYIAEEMSFCESENIDLILSDIVPQSFLVARELGIPGIGISNFTWHFIYSHLLGPTESVQRLKGAYEMADGALVLPFNEEMALLKSRQEISLISRKITPSIADLISESGLLVYMGLGKSLDASFFLRLRHIEGFGLQFLVSSGTNFPLKNVIKIPPEETETQNYIAMCDLVVSKAGYSTVSEAIRAGVPMCIFGRDGYEEDRLIANGIEALGIGRKISEEQFLEGEWRGELDHLEQYSSKYDDLNSRYRNDGLPEAVSYIREAVF
jgi:UDP:flavonoid glycosyltransferase YjiC (YdhE family)